MKPNISDLIISKLEDRFFAHISEMQKNVDNGINTTRYTISFPAVKYLDLGLTFLKERNLKNDARLARKTPITSMFSAGSHLVPDDSLECFVQLTLPQRSDAEQEEIEELLPIIKL